MHRRTFVFASATSLTAAPRPAALTAGAVVEKIQRNLGIPWRTPTVDTFKAGAPDTEITGIATTFMATFDVLQRAATAGKNLVITHEPTFWNHEDQTKDFAADPVYAAKAAFIEKHRMVVFRFHDHWHARRPDGIMAGVVEALGWEKFRDPDQRGFAIPATTLDGLAHDLRDRLKVRTMRIIGDPRMAVRRIAYGPGFTSLQSVMRTLARPEMDVIALGHAISEEPGMKECAAWLKTFISEVPVEFVPAGEPFWTPK